MGDEVIKTRGGDGRALGSHKSALIVSAGVFVKGWGQNRDGELGGQRDTRREIRVRSV